MASYDIELVHPFTMSHAQAFQQAQQLIPHLFGQYSAQLTGAPQLDWQGSRCTFSLPTQAGNVQGILDVYPTRLEVYIQLPFMAKLFKNQAEQAIQQQLQTYFR